MLNTIEGIYRDGRIELAEQPADVSESRVLVTFLDDPAAARASRMIEYGKFRGDRRTNEEDFRAAEWRGTNQGAA